MWMYKDVLRNKPNTRLILLDFYKIFLKIIFNNVYFVDQNGKGLGLEESGYYHCVHFFCFLLPVSGERGETREGAIPSLPTTPIPRDEEWPSSINLGSQCSAHCESSAPVVLIVLKGCHSHQLKDEGIFPMSVD